MIFIIGGYGQGKLNYVKHAYAVREENIFCGSVPKRDGGISEEAIVIAQFNRIAENRMRQGADAMELVEQLIKKYPNCIIISDEIGNGIVPMDAEERRLREEIGRLQIQIAQLADEVVRVICGLGQKIK